MIEKGKISASQLGIMIFPVVISYAVLVVPSITYKYAKQDMWFSIILASAVGFIVVILAVKLNKLFPQQSVTTYIELVFGRMFSKPIIVIMLLFYLDIGSTGLRQYSEFITGAFLLQTPGIVITLSMVFVSCLAARGGVEVIARVSQFFVPLVISVLVFIFVLLIPEFHVRHLFPIFGDGITPPLKGAILPMAWYVQFFTIAFLLPYVSDREKSLRWCLLSVVSVVVVLSMAGISAVLVFGNITETLPYAVMAASRYISIADFLEHLESVVMAVWVAGAFIRMTVLIYVVSIETAEFLKLSNFKPIVYPIGFLFLLFSFWSGENLQDVANSFKTGTFYLGTFQLVLPFVLLCIALIKFKKRK